MLFKICEKIKILHFWRFDLIWSIRFETEPCNFDLRFISEIQMFGQKIKILDKILGVLVRLYI